MKSVKRLKRKNHLIKKLIETFEDYIELLEFRAGIDISGKRNFKAEIEKLKKQFNSIKLK